MQGRFGRGTYAGGVAQHAIVDDTQQIMGKERWHPGSSDMAQVATGGRRNMIQGLTGSDSSLQNRVNRMAVGTTSGNYFSMIDQFIGWRPGCRAHIMTGITDVGCCRMGRGFSGSGAAIMATGAATENIIVVHLIRRHRSPGGREFQMATVADIAGGYMQGAFTAGLLSIMASDAVADKRTVIDGSRYPGDRTMTQTAVVIRGQVVSALARGDHAIMTAGTGTNGFVMIELLRRHRLPRDKIPVTGFTAVSRGHVLRGFAGSLKAIVATCAVTGNTTVVKKCRYPGDYRMTNVTGFRGRNMVCWDSTRVAIGRLGRAQTMAFIATTGKNLCMIHHDYR